MSKPTGPMLKSERYVAYRSMVQDGVAIVIRDTERNRGFVIPEDELEDFSNFMESVTQEWLDK